MNGAGALESILTMSAEQPVIGNGMLGMTLGVLRGIEISERTLAEDITRQVDPAGNYSLDDPHMEEQFRMEHFIPQIFDRKTRMMWEKAGSEDVVAASKETAQELLREHETAERGGLILRAAKKEIGSSQNAT